MIQQSEEMQEEHIIAGRTTENTHSRILESQLNLQYYLHYYFLSLRKPRPYGLQPLLSLAPKHQHCFKTEHFHFTSTRSMSLSFLFVALSIASIAGTGPMPMM